MSIVALVLAPLLALDESEQEANHDEPVKKEIVVTKKEIVVTETGGPAALR